MEKSAIAAIDIGSNTIHLTVIRGREHIVSRTHLLGLGKVVERDHRLTPGVIGRIRSALRDLVRQARKAKASPILIGATAALRNAPNGRAVLKKLSRDLGVPIQLISEERECALGFDGVRSLLRAGERTLFVDSGGGSTEITLAQGKTAVKSVSLPIGSAKLSAALHGDPPEPLDLAQIMVSIAQALQSAPKGLTPQRAIFTGGSANHLGILAGAKPGQLTLDDINRALRRLVRRRSKKLANKFGIPADRIALLAPGALILGAILQHYQLTQATITHQGLRDGLVLEYLRHTK